MNDRPPLRLVLIGGGAAGLAAADALGAALGGSEPVVELTLVEGPGNEGIAAPWPLAEPSARGLHPEAPYRAPRPEHLVLVPRSATALRALCADLGLELGPPPAARGVAALLGPPDVASRHRLVLPLGVVDPKAPALAREPRARALLAAAAAPGAALALLERLLAQGEGPLADCLAFADVLFTDALSFGLRWTLALGAGRARALPEDWAEGLSAEDLFERLWREVARPGLERALDLAPPAREADERLRPLLEVLRRDGEALARGEGPWDPRASLALAYASGASLARPFALDGPAALQGLRQLCELDPLQVLDVGALRAALKERVTRRFVEGEVAGQALPEAWASRLSLFGARVSGVELTDNCDRPAPLVPQAQAGKKGIPTTTLDADLVLAALPPACLVPLCAGVEEEAGQRALARWRSLSTADVDTAHLVLALPERMRLPFGGEEAPSTLFGPFGPFTAVVDLGAAAPSWPLALEPGAPRRFFGTALALFGPWPALFFGEPDEAFPASVREVLLRLTQDAEQMEPAFLEERPFAAKASPRAPVLGQVEALQRTRYLERFIEEAAPLVVSRVLKALARLPGTAPASAQWLLDEAERTALGRRPRARWALTRRCHAESRAFVPGPGDEALRPPAGHQTPVEGLFVAGAWTQSGVFAPALEAEVRSGLLAAAAVLERLREQGVVLRAR
jgi:hypothetical protein